MKTQRTISRILIANRGEIARRIIRTAHRLKIETVAVFTEPDHDAPHVLEATCAFNLGPPDQYLNAQALVNAARATGADAIHPGYGFLSESAAFARLVTDAGLVFIGPSPEAIEKLGSKTKAKALADLAHVPTSPTLLFTSTDLATRATNVAAFGKQVGYPLLVKASAGGGGRGMRILTEASDVAAELESASREALKAFGDGEVFVERFLSPARHIEIQIAADSHGTAVALGSRDCSLQRNNQKILEEAPAPNLLPGVEQKLFQAAESLARAAGYSNLGTVEFLYLADGSFYFLEVNTRLQVEHPVTEEVTGLDLVEMQIRIAEGVSLADVGVSHTPTPRGHAIEARLCAEEYRDGRFITATGVVLDLEVPTTTSTGLPVRAEMAIEPCSTVSHYYDSMVGKIIVRAETRSDALSALADTLSRSRVSGVATNRALLLHLLTHPTFIHGTHTIQGSKELFPSSSLWEELEDEAHALLAAIRAATPLSPWSEQSPWMTAAATALSHVPTPLATRTPEGRILRSKTIATADGFTVTISGGDRDTTRHVDLAAVTIHTPHLRVAVAATDGAPPLQVVVYDDTSSVWVHLPRGSVVLSPVSGSARHDPSSAGGASSIKAHLPGKIIALSVSAGMAVEAGQVVGALDSMKMEHPLRAPCDGTVSAVHAAVGAVVQTGTVLVEITPS